MEPGPSYTFDAFRLELPPGAYGGATPARMRRELAQAHDVLTADAPLVLVRVGARRTM
jgi:hypothetical protein